MIPAIMTILSAVALGMVVALHVPTLPKHWVLGLAVPWFFFASGFWFDGDVKKRVRTLLVPYFAWNLLWFPVLFVCNWIGWRYCGAERVVDGSLGCIARCLGLSPWAWPALVPTWYLRALFCACVVYAALGWFGKCERLETWRKWGMAVLLWGAYLTREIWMPEGELWAKFFVFTIPLHGLAMFALGAAVRGEWFKGEEKKVESRWREESKKVESRWREESKKVESRWREESGLKFKGEGLRLGFIRRQMMPVYVIHAAVIISVGWVFKAVCRYEFLETTAGDIVMWFVGIIGAALIGEAMRRFLPQISTVLFGGR